MSGTQRPGSTSEGSSAMVSLKFKMQMMREELIKYRELYERTTRDLDEEKITRSTVVGEVNGLKQQMLTMEKQLEKLNAEHKDITGELESAVKGADERDRARRALEHRTNMDEDRLLVLEQMVKEANDAVTESDKRCDELTRKLGVTEADLQRAEHKADAAHQNVKDLEQEMFALCSKLKVLQNQDEKASEREERYERSIAQLSAGIRAAETNNINADNIISQLQHQIDTLQGEVQRTKNSNQSLRSELHA